MYKILFVLCFLLFITLSGKGQVVSIDSLRNDFDQSYGLDVLLNNGRKYFPNSNPVTGHPFWRSADSFNADITISGKTFKDQLLKFDLNKQEFLLFYTNFNGQQGQIILNHSGIDSVNTENYSFIANKIPEIRQPIVQLVYQGKISCYIGWYKELNFNTTGVNVGYKYTDAIRINYLVINGAVHRFKNKHEFLHIFKGKNKGLIRKYMSTHRIRFKNMDKDILRALITYCEETLN